MRDNGIDPPLCVAIAIQYLYECRNCFIRLNFKISERNCAYTSMNRVVCLTSALHLRCDVLPFLPFPTRHQRSRRIRVAR